ncbi:hypothetical protein NH8B_2091 [Pseudogulbenkiania sp. NH8B]|uniref:hypothetical protein n=1 Tax=Pseudogulbenkiania sp. (strain NH8B) TaxID=748280 RepID=UPI0002279B48|nr:hypothetical protein [Pseudogulbenkiania sp. NH8B]BAK76477.1 hypothetical protein NH8B_1660 [Pseudogulbenkiania sp. NH8B]BAK76906.1 hypothetical protein NH8B_2091 [Pseudogulbenkiania sp. NH8B]
MSVDLQKIRRENMRWQILLVLNNARPVGAYEEVILSVVQALYPDATAHEVRLQLDYLADRQLVKLEREPGGRWFADLTRLGVDIAEYTVDCQPGIARPEKYWSA